MKWGDPLIRGQVDMTLAMLREGENEFRKLTATGDPELAEEIAKLHEDLLRSIVFGRVMAARYQPREEATGGG